MKEIVISKTKLPECVEEFAEKYANAFPNFRQCVVNANEAFEARNDINLGTNARLIAEILCNMYFYRYSAMKGTNLATKIKILPQLGYFSPYEINLLDNMRKMGNSSVHAENNEYLDLYRIYSEFYNNIESFLSKADAIDEAENLPKLNLGNQKTKEEFMLYSDSIRRAYGGMKGRAYFYTVLAVFFLGMPAFTGFALGVGFAFSPENPLSGSVGALLEGIMFGALFLWIMRNIYSKRKATNPKLAYEYDQKRYNHRVKQVHDFWWPSLNGTIDYSINWDDLYKD